jgi:hypothetical protein
METFNWQQALNTFLNLPLPIMLVVSGIVLFAFGAGLKIPLGGQKSLALSGRESRKWAAVVGGMLLVFSGIGMSILVEDLPNGPAPVMPTAIITPTLDPSLPNIQADPQQTVISYYAALNAGQYETAWDSLSFRFQREHNDDDFAAYRDYWDSAPTVVVVSLETSDIYGSYANLAVGLYYANIQQTLNFQFDLIYDYARQQWLIDEVTSTD